VKAGPGAILKARTAAGLSQSQAAALALVSKRAWIKWENGQRAISAPAWALFRLRSGQLTLAGLDAETGTIHPGSDPSKR
jgi:transcriptional regulator with XRE-family HTH domain